MGVHQKIDRVARHHIRNNVPRTLHFPTSHDILHFEGLNGPDGIKRKSPGKDEPWHFIDPFNGEDKALIAMIDDHIQNMALALKEHSNERAAFEAAWMAHAIVDGLTPAHHYPLEAKLEELRNGEGLNTRISKRDKLVLPGKTRRHQLRNNWEFWGAKGVMTTHLAFELGVASAIATTNFDDAGPSEADFARVDQEGFTPSFHAVLQDVAAMKMYEEFSRLGWTRHLAKETKNVLIPHMIKAVTLAWYQAIVLAERPL